MTSNVAGFKEWLSPVQRRLAQVDLREHEDKILLLLALVVSAVVGLIVVGFLAATERMSSILVNAGPWQRFWSPLVGSLVGGWLLFRFFPDARGSGIPQTRVALILQNGFIGIRTVVGKFICSSISLGSGVALGREGPSVQIGAGVASFAGRRLGLSDEHIRSLIPVGTAAAIAAAFNTPLAAVLFTLEEILADLHARLVGSVVIGAATSWIVLRLILGDEPLFHVPAYQLVHPIEFLIYGLLGVGVGLLSTAFVKLLLWQRTHFLKTPTQWKAFTPAVGGLTVGLLAIFQPGVLGVGYNLVSDALNGRMELKVMVILMALKLIATATSYSSGNAGGIFGPSLFMGAMMGGAVGQVAHMVLPDHTGNAGAYALVGMGAAFAGIVRTPMTSVIMIFEVTRDYTIIVPLMIANMLSYLVAQRLQKHPIYEALSAQDGIVMPSPGHLPGPLTVERAVRPLDTAATAARVAERPYVHPDDPLDSALQRMGEAHVDEILVVSRAGHRMVGVLTIPDVLKAYGRLAEEKEASLKQASRNWVPVIAAATVMAVMIISGLVFWQRSRQVEQGKDAYRNGEKLMALGQVDEAVLDFRNALAHTPGDIKARTALGLALLQTNHFAEADAYLSSVAKSDSQSGPVFSGLAKIAQSRGDKQQALVLLRQALAKDWPTEQDPQRKNAQLEFAKLLSDAGRPTEAIASLLAIIEQSGDDPAIGKRAADMVKEIGSPDKAEEAYAALTVQFPADVGTWLKLGDARFAESKDSAALEAYRRAVKADPENPEAKAAVARSEDISHLDPTQRGLSIRDRAQRWDEVLERIQLAATPCGSTPELEKATALLKKRTVSLELLDEKMASAIALWSKTGAACKTDPVLSHTMSKLGK